MPSLADFLAEDFTRFGEAVLHRAMAIDGQRLVLSGATGFFGTSLLALLALLHSRGARFEVSAFSRDPQRFFAAHAWAQKLGWLRLMQGDARHPWPVTGAHSLLMHGATDTHASAHQNLQTVFDHEVASVQQALACAASCGVQRVLLTGSGAQYGAITPDASGRGAREDAPAACDPLQPASAYGEGKRVGELLAALHAQRHGTAVVATRCFAFVGPGLPLDGHFAIGNFLRDALSGQDIRLKSSGQAMRGWLYSADLAMWLLLLLLEAPGGTAVNVGSDEALTVLEGARRVCAVVHPQGQVHAGTRVDGEPRSFYVPQLARARALGLDVWTPLDHAIARTTAWHRQRAAAAA